MINFINIAVLTDSAFYSGKSLAFTQITMFAKDKESIFNSSDGIMQSASKKSRTNKMDLGISW